MELNDTISLFLASRQGHRGLKWLEETLVLEPRQVGICPKDHLHPMEDKILPRAANLRAEMEEEDSLTLRGLTTRTRTRPPRPARTT